MTTSWEFPDFVPEGWVEANDDLTKNCTNEDDAEEELDLPPGWNATVSDAGNVYYWHDDMESTSWDFPDWIPEGWTIPKDYFVGSEPIGDLPEGWEVAEAEGKVYYFNEETNEVSWELPCAKGDLEAVGEQIENKTNHSVSPWKLVQTDDGEDYYHNTETNETSWDIPM